VEGQIEKENKKEERRRGSRGARTRKKEEGIGQLKKKEEDGAGLRLLHTDFSYFLIIFYN